MPSAELRAVFEVTRTEAWAASTSWSRMSRGRRALNFLIRQPPRLPAMYIVRAALAASNRDDDRSLTDC
jgi:hypothetical protein